MTTLAIIAAIITTCVYMKRVYKKQYTLATNAGFFASLSHFALFLSYGNSPIRSILYSSMCFVAMIFVWFVVDIARHIKAHKEYALTRPILTYFIGGMCAFIGFSNLCAYL